MAVFQNRIVRWGVGVTLSLGVATAGIGFLHTGLRLSRLGRHLWSVAGWKYGGGAQDASERLAIAAGSLERALGAPQQRAGDVAALARGESGAPSVAYRFENDLADLSGSSVAGRHTFRRQYTSGLVLAQNAQGDESLKSQ